MCEIQTKILYFKLYWYSALLQMPCNKIWHQSVFLSKSQEGVARRESFEFKFLHFLKQSLFPTFAQMREMRIKSLEMHNKKFANRSKSFSTGLLEAFHTYWIALGGCSLKVFLVVICLCICLCHCLQLCCLRQAAFMLTGARISHMAHATFVNAHLKNCSLHICN